MGENNIYLPAPGIFVRVNIKIYHDLRRCRGERTIYRCCRYETTAVVYVDSLLNSAACDPQSAVQGARSQHGEATGKPGNLRNLTTRSYPLRDGNRATALRPPLMLPLSSLPRPPPLWKIEQISASLGVGRGRKLGIGTVRRFRRHHSNHRCHCRCHCHCHCRSATAAADVGATTTAAAAADAGTHYRNEGFSS